MRLSCCLLFACIVGSAAEVRAQTFVVDDVEIGDQSISYLNIEFSPDMRFMAWVEEGLGGATSAAWISAMDPATGELVPRSGRGFKIANIARDGGPQWGTDARGLFAVAVDLDGRIVVARPQSITTGGTTTGVTASLERLPTPPNRTRAYLYPTRVTQGPGRLAYVQEDAQARRQLWQLDLATPTVETQVTSGPVASIGTFALPPFLVDIQRWFASAETRADGLPILIYGNADVGQPNPLVRVEQLDFSGGTAQLSEVGPPPPVLLDPFPFTYAGQRYMAAGQNATASGIMLRRDANGQYRSVVHSITPTGSTLATPSNFASAEPFTWGGDVYTAFQLNEPGAPGTAPGEIWFATAFDGRILRRISSATPSRRADPEFFIGSERVWVHYYARPLVGGTRWALRRADTGLVRDTTPPAADYSGAWFDPSQSGHGLFLEQGLQGQLVAAWFTFDPQGRPAWFAGVGTVAGGKARFRVIRTLGEGGRFIPNFDPARVANEEFGSLAFDFSRCDAGTLDYDLPDGFGRGQLNLQRLTQPASIGCAPPREVVAATTPIEASGGTWFDPAQSGHGLVTAVLPGNQLLAYWFTFEPQGGQAWFGGVGPIVNGVADIAVVRTEGGRFPPNFDSASIRNAAFGTLRLSFSTCSAGRVDYDLAGGFGRGSMTLARLTQPLASVCPTAAAATLEAPKTLVQGAQGQYARVDLPSPGPVTWAITGGAIVGASDQPVVQFNAGSGSELTLRAEWGSAAALQANVPLRAAGPRLVDGTIPLAAGVRQHAVLQLLRGERITVDAELPAGAPPAQFSLFDFQGRAIAQGNRIDQRAPVRGSYYVVVDSAQAGNLRVAGVRGAAGGGAAPNGALPVLPTAIPGRLAASVDAAGSFSAGESLVRAGDRVVSAVFDFATRSTRVRAYQNGSIAWTWTSATDEYLRSLAALPDGSVAGIGSAGGAGAGADEVLVVRLSSDGRLLARARFGTAGYDYGYGIAVTVDGALMASGFTSGALPGKVNAGGLDAFAVRVEADGRIGAQHQFGSAADDRLFASCALASGDVVLFGDTEGNLVSGSTAAGEFDLFVAGLGADAVPRWSRQWGSAGNDLAFDCAADPASGDFYLTGMTTGVLEPGAVDPPQQQVFTMRLDGATRATRWARQIGPAEGQSGETLALSDRGVGVLFYTNGSFPGTSNNSLGSRLSDDMVVAHYRADGALEWLQQFDDTRERIFARGLAFVGGDVYTLRDRVYLEGAPFSSSDLSRFRVP